MKNHASKDMIPKNNNTPQNPPLRFQNKFVLPLVLLDPSIFSFIFIDNGTSPIL